MGWELEPGRRRREQVRERLESAQALQQRLLRELALGQVVFDSMVEASNVTTARAAVQATIMVVVRIILLRRSHIVLGIAARCYLLSLGLETDGIRFGRAAHSAVETAGARIRVAIRNSDLRDNVVVNVIPAEG